MTTADLSGRFHARLSNWFLKPVTDAISAWKKIEIQTFWHFVFIFRHNNACGMCGINIFSELAPGQKFSSDSCTTENWA
jgi:hypothetical protein